MRRILLFSLLSASVLGLPSDIYPLEYDYYNNNSSNAVDEVDYYESLDTSSDNCSLAVPLYYPLRRSESFFKGIRGDIIRSANSEANYIEERRRWIYRDRDFRFGSRIIFYTNYPLDTEFDYKDAIATGSQYYLRYTDIFHSYISWEDLGRHRYTCIGHLYKTEKDIRYICNSLTSIADAEMLLDELVPSLSGTGPDSLFSYNSYQNMMKNVARLIKPDTWPYLASCLFEAFKENKDTSSLGLAITDLVSDEDFEKFNQHFERYVGDIARALKTFLEADQTQMAETVQLMYELTKSEIKSIDYNSLQSTLYYLVLQLKTVLMKPDIQELYTKLNQTDYFVQESVWKLDTGRWPEMERFVDNFLRRTAGSIVFWDRLTGEFITEVKNKIPDLVDWMRDNDVDIANVDIHPIVDKVFSIMNMVAEGDKASIRQLFEDIRESRWDKTITSYIGFLGDLLTSCNLATVASELPSYNDIKSTVNNNDFFQPIKTLLFKDWPQDEIYPASIEDFVRRIYETRFSIFDAIFGNSPCDGTNKAPRILTRS